MIDTHAHINIAPLIEDIDDVLLRAKQCGIKKIICIGINKATNQLAIQLAETYPEVYASVGIHPSEVDEAVTYVEYLSHPKVVAIGEIGIDLYWRQDNLALQKERFIEQLKIAQRNDLPVIIHSRNSSDVIIDILKQYPVKGVMHCYSEHPSLLKDYLSLGFYIGVGGIVTFKNAKDVLTIVGNTPLDRLLLETDAPYLAPVPYRGKTNEPKNTLFVLEKVAELRQLSKHTLNDITTENAYRLFPKLNNLI